MHKLAYNKDGTLLKMDLQNSWINIFKNLDGLVLL